MLVVVQMIYFLSKIFYRKHVFYTQNDEVNIFFIAVIHPERYRK